LPMMMLLYHVRPSAPMLLFPVFVALQALFTIGLALILATGTAFFRDVRHLVEIALAVLFWTTPIVYELRQIPSPLQLPILLSPMSPFVHAYHEIFYYRAWPGAGTWAIVIGYTAVALAIGLWLIVRYEDRFAEQV